MKNIRLIVSDIDGVLTDGTFYMDAEMNEWKRICYRDLDSIRLGRTNGLDFVFLTAEDTPMSHAIGKRFGVEIRERVKDKLIGLKQVCADRGIAREQVCYIGDSDREELPLKWAGIGVAPCDGTEIARASADYISAAKGGDGVLFEVTKMLVAAKKGEISETKPHLRRSDNALPSASVRA